MSTLVIAFFLILHLVRPDLPIDTITILLLGLLLAIWFLPYVKKVKLPGGPEFEFELSKETQEVEEKVKAAQKAEPAKPLVDPAQEKDLQLAKLRDATEEVRRLLAAAARDKPMALVRIWIDIEHELRTHMAVRGWLTSRQWVNVRVCRVRQSENATLQVCCCILGVPALQLSIT